MYELILKPKLAEEKPSILIPFGIFITLLSYFIYAILKDNILLFSTRISFYFIETLILTQITTKLFEMFELEEEEGKLNYWKVIKVYIFLSLGILIGLLLVPTSLKLEFSKAGNSLYIIFNNLTLAFTFFLIAFMFGTGAEFLLIYNLDLLAYAIRFKLILLPLAFIEFLGFFSFALAGGILSISLVRNKLKKNIFLDTIKFMLVGISLIIFAYFFELFIINL